MSKLLDYIKEAKLVGFDQEKIKEILTARGWEKSEIERAISQVEALQKEGRPNLPPPSKEEAELKEKKIDISRVFLIIGGFIMVVAAGVFLATNWQDLGFWKVPILFIIMAGLYFWGFSLKKKKKLFRVAYALTGVASAIFPLFFYVFLTEYNLLEPGTPVVGLTVSFTTLFLYVMLLWRTKYPLFSLLSAGLGLVALFFVLEKLGVISVMDTFAETAFYLYICLGLTYLFLGWFLGEKGKKDWAKYINFLGTELVLYFILLLGMMGKEPFYETALLVASLSFVFLSIPRQSKIFLYSGMVFLVIYVFSLSVEYFSDNIGWPLALLVAGLMCVGIGYGIEKVRKRYLK